MRQPGFDCMAMDAEVTIAPLKVQAVADFEELAMPLVNSAYNLARWLVRNDHDAEDLVQETYLKALRNFRSFQHGTNFRAWLFRILRNTFLSSRSKLEWRMTDELNCDEEASHLQAHGPCPESLLILKSTVSAIRSAIEQLPFACREVILLRDVEDFSYREIAEIVEIPMGTVMSRLSRARSAVRDTLCLAAINQFRQPAGAFDRTGEAGRMLLPEAQRIG